MLYDALKPIVRIALHWYYRSITVAGAERIPEHGPVFLAVNHPNALVDALVVAVATKRRVRFTAKATIFSGRVAKRFLGAVGVVPLRRASDEAAAGSASTDPSRNAAAFDAVADALGDGAAIVIFPEGKSHDAPQLAPLRTGLARMVRMARHERGVRGIRIVPVGLLFEEKEEPRSRVLVQIGEPIDIDSFQEGAAMVTALTDAVAARLAAVTLNFESADDAQRIGLVGDTLAALVEPLRSVGEDVVPLATTLSLVRRIDRAHRLLLEADARSADRDDREPAAQQSVPVAPRIATFEQRLRAFRDRLHTEGIDVHDVAIELRASLGVRFALREAAIALLLLPFVLWGRITHFVPVRLARALALRNVRARDEPAMRTLVGGFALVLFSYAVETAVVAALAGPWWALLFLASLVPSASSDFRYGDRLRTARRRARAYFHFRGDPSLQPALTAEADWLRAEAAALERLAAE